MTLPRNTLIFLFARLRIFDKYKEVSPPTIPDNTFSRERDSVNMALGLHREKKDQIIQQCQSLLTRPSVTIRESTQLTGWLTATEIAVLSAPLQY